MMCKHCSIPMTIHKTDWSIRCHLCGISKKLPKSCPDCGDNDVLAKGYGTQRIEDIVSKFLPKAKVVRIDADVMQKKNLYRKIFNDFRVGKIDVLIGTQMIAKGLDFPNVTLVGLVDADRSLHIEDFRANERAFQLIEQVSGRTGRRTSKGKVVIQSMKPRHAIIQMAMNHDYDGMLQRELVVRNEYGYPPYVRLITITIKHRDYRLLERAASEFARSLRSKIGDRFLGPEYAPIARLNNLYQMQIIIKVDKNSVGIKVRDRITKAHQEVLMSPEFHRVKVIYDVDPNS